MIYNYFAQRKNTKRVIVILGVAFCALLIVYSKQLQDQSLYYYFYSTVVQGFLALIAFLGAVVIYRLQIIENELQKMSDKLQRPMVYYRGAPAETYAWKETLTEAKKILQESKDGNFRHEIEWSSKKMEELLRERGEARTKMVDFCLLSFVNVLTALIGLPLSRLVILLSQKAVIGTFVNSTYLIVVTLLSLFSVFYAFKVIRLIMGYSFSKTIKEQI